MAGGHGANYARRGYGVFAFEQKSTPGVVGFCGIVHPDNQPDPEIKSAWLRAHWGKGFATEAAVGLLHYGARVHGLRHVIATAAPANAASHRVLLKAGMVRGPLRNSADGSQTQSFQRWRAT